MEPDVRTGWRHPRRFVVAYGCLFLGFVIVYLYVHRQAGFTFPIPWQDEGSFLWEALAWQRHGHLHAPQLNAERPLMWEFPGLMVWHGTLFEWTGFSLGGTRLLCAFYILGALGFLAATFRRFAAPFACLTLAGAFLLNRHFVFMGNIFRMESLVLLLVAAAVYLYQRRAYYKGLVSLSLAMLVHPAGWYFMLGAGIHFLVVFARHPEVRRPSRVDVAAIASSLALWFAYALYVVRHWQHFVEDMSFQLKFKGRFLGQQGGFWSGWSEAENALGLLLAAGCVAWAIRRRHPVAGLGGFALGAKVMVVTAPGALYRVYDAFFYLLLSVMLLELVLDALRASGAMGAGRAEARASALVLGALLVANGLLQNVESPVGYPRHMRVLDMGFADEGVPYIEAEDRAVVRRFLEARPSSDRPLLVQFYPQADALFFHELEGEKLRFLQPTFDDRIPDLHILHRTRYLPPLAERIQTLQLRTYGLPARDLESWPLLHRRDGTEEWRFWLRR